jgi:hemolysin III
VNQSHVEEEYTVGEEVAHALTHGVGALLSAVGLAFLIVLTLGGEGSWRLWSTAVFGVSMVLLYTASTLYHAFPWPRIKGIFKTFDHIAIYFLIAGTYTPFALITLGGTQGWVLLALVWGLALAGSIFEVVTRGKRMKIALAFYLLMGWVAVFFIQALAALLSPTGLVLLVLGGLFYTVGAIFYAWKKLPYNHVVWHLFVLAGSFAHFFCILHDMVIGS